MKTSKSSLQLALLAECSENYCADFANAATYKQRVRAAAKFCAERHMIYLRKAAGLPPPWTNDPVLRNFRFCNIYRELDTVSKWITGNWITPYVGTKSLAARAVFGRVVNLPSTLGAMLEAGIDLQTQPRPGTLFKLFNSLKAQKKQLVTGAYIVNTIFPKDAPRVDGSKADYIANQLVPALFEHLPDMSSALQSGSFRETVAAMRKVHGVGGFLANQAAVDLSYTALLSGAPDLHTTWSPGPGTLKGIRWISGDWALAPGGKETDAALTRYRDDLNALLSRHPLWCDDPHKYATNIVPLSGPNASNSLCELSKEVWMVLGWRNRMKNTYTPGRANR